MAVIRSEVTSPVIYEILQCAYHHCPVYVSYTSLLVESKSSLVNGSAGDAPSQSQEPDLLGGGASPLSDPLSTQAPPPANQVRQ